MVFPIIGEFPFNGHMPVVLVLTVVFGFAIAAVSYALVESPCRVALRRWEYRNESPIPPLDWGYSPRMGPRASWGLGPHPPEGQGDAVSSVPEPVAR
jgi:peptidoglycan/LPS O-acetylase OafA/YrhL